MAAAAAAAGAPAVPAAATAPEAAAAPAAVAVDVAAARPVAPAPAAVVPAAAAAAAATPAAVGDGIAGATTTTHCAAAAAAGHPCVLDLGFNTGQDSHFYLRDGYSVVAVDANPDLIAAGARRFAAAAANGSLTLVSNGLVGSVRSAAADGAAGEAETLRFYRSKLRSEWSSFDASWGCRNPNNTPVEAVVPAHCEVIEVPVTTCGGLIERFGKPLYMKVRGGGWLLLALVGWQRGGVGADPQSCFHAGWEKVETRTVALPT